MSCEKLYRWSEDHLYILRLLLSRISDDCISIWEVLMQRKFPPLLTFLGRRPPGFFYLPKRQSQILHICMLSCHHQLLCSFLKGADTFLEIVVLILVY